MYDIFAWLDAPASQNTGDELAALHTHLKSLRHSTVLPAEHATVLARLFSRCLLAANTLTPKLSSSSLPIPRKTRQLVRSLQDLLQELGCDLATLAPRLNDNDTETQTEVLWQSLVALSQHLLISDLVAAPATAGIWLQLHQSHEMARQLGLVDRVPKNEVKSLQEIYYSAILLGCAQPASLSSAEVVFVAINVGQFAKHIELINDSEADTPAAFWIDPAKDSPAVACTRKPAPPETPVHFFSCAQIAETLKQLLCAVESGLPTPELNADAFAHTNAGRGVMRRLIANWGEPGKRRFTRRRQSDRANLYAGLDCLWKLFHNQASVDSDASTWMITNQSPDGYTVMHLSGNVGEIRVGDICAVRTESENEWKVGIIRWIQSENQEHLELGLQILATQAVSASLAQPEATRQHPIHSHSSVLVLPGTPPLRSAEMLVTASGTVSIQPKNLVLIVEKENLGIREVINTRLHEQNSQIEVFAIVTNETNN